MKNKILMLVEFALSLALIGFGLMFAFDNIFQNFFFIFMGFVVLILAAYRVDELLGNGPYNKDNQKTNGNQPTND